MTKENKQIRKFEVVSKYKDSNIIMPIRKTKYSAGYDICSAVDITIPSIWKQVFQFIGKNNIGNNKQAEKLISDKLANGETIVDIMKEYNLKPTLIPTGIKAYMHDDEVLKLYSRSSTPMKKGLVVSNSVAIIDKDFEQEMFVQVLNFLPFDVEIKKGEAIAQGLFQKYLTTDDDIESVHERSGGFGSTDKQ